MIGVLCALLIGVFYKWVLKDWAYSKAARLGSLAFILVALLTGFMSDMFNESIGMALRIEENSTGRAGGKIPGAGLRVFYQRAPSSPSKMPGCLPRMEQCGLTMRQTLKAGGSPLLYLFMSWFGLYLLCAQRFFKRNLVPRKAYFKLQMINVTVFIIYLRMGFGISPSEYHYIVTRFQYLFGGGM